MNTTNFANRHIGPREEDQNQMLKTIGVDTLDQLIYETLPDGIKLKKPLNLDEPMSEYEYLTHIHELSKLNKTYKTYIGLGYHPTILPPVIQRNILENPGWYTAYTPYQAEIAQGRLEHGNGPNRNGTCQRFPFRRKHSCSRSHELVVCS